MLACLGPKNYSVIQHKHATESIVEALTSLNIKAEAELKTSRHGVHLDFDFPEAVFELKEVGEKFTSGIRVFSDYSHVSGLVISARVTRLACTNGMVITDVVMPDENAFDMLPRIRRARPDLPVLVMSAQNTFMTAIKASEGGAYDYLPKPFDLTEMIGTIGRALSEPRKVAAQPEDTNEGMPLVGRSAAMQEIYRVLARLMQTDLTLMITGESGTGKELVARALHDYGKRRDGPFVAINMAAIPRDLIES